MLPAVKFFLGQDAAEADGTLTGIGQHTVVGTKHPCVCVCVVCVNIGQRHASTGGSDNESDGETKPSAPTKEDVYRAYHKGTTASKKKKQAKLKRVMSTLRKTSKSEEAAKRESFAALQLLHDPQVC